MNKYIDEVRIQWVKRKNRIILCIATVGFIIIGFMMIAIAIGGIRDGEYMTVVVAELFFLIFLAMDMALIWMFIKSNKMVDRAFLYARYFEGDLDGYIYISDMEKIVGYNSNEIYQQLNELLRKRYMLNFFLRANNGKTQIVLLSKIAKCECKNCGAIIDKKVYFAGVCPYCKSSDIYAELIK